ncbi:MAG: hypothetical protein IZT59_00825 [Verrucomicrobia bacterium]|jgi:hypothetical protein|nr:hypothetical protein [Verrucomicrobiota bacterium]|tara:strand:+ start:25571 stop:27523 length:1953 start_codon:yes stop_codon:yes gene_type:complete
MLERCIFLPVKGYAFLIFGLVCSTLYANEPGSAALDFLGKVRDGKVDLEPGGDTALQEHTAEAKRLQIRKRLERLGEDLQGGRLELGEVKEEGEFAAVMVNKTGGFDSGHLQIFPVALVKRGADWFPAPVLASFENAVAGYTVPLRKRVGGLEGWMSRERVLGLEKLISESAERTRDLIKGNIVGENLEGDDIGKIADLFMEACADGKQAAVLGFLGGLGEPLPSDWAERLRASQAAVSSAKDLGSAWRLIVSPDVVRVRVNEERSEKAGLVSIACLDPARAEKSGTLGKIEILHLEFTKDEGGRWKIDLPYVLLHNDADELDSDDDLDVDLLDRFPRDLRKYHPLEVAPTAAVACDTVLTGLKSGGLRNVLAKVDFSGKGKDARIACGAAAEIWWSLNQPGSFRAPVALGFREEGILAAATYQWFLPADPDQFELKTLYFKKSEKGWIWAPGVVSVKERKSQKVLSQWIKDSEPNWRLSWRGGLLVSSERVAKIDFSDPLEDGEVKELVAKWLDALAVRDLDAALGWVAWLGEEGDIPIKALRNLSYDLENSRQGRGTLQKIYRSASWVAARVSTGEGDEAKEFFLPILSTPKGARLLPEIDLLVGENRTRKFLNRVSFDRLQKFAGKEKIEELKELFNEFEKEVKRGG